VRVEKRKLSNALAEYYRNGGKDDPIRISIDGYRAVFAYAPHYQPPASAAIASEGSDDGPDFLAEPRDWEDELPDLANPIEYAHKPGHYLLRRNENKKVRLPKPLARWLWAKEEGRVYLTFATWGDASIYPRQLPRPDDFFVYFGVDEKGERVLHHTCDVSVESQVEPNGCLDVGGQNLRLYDNDDIFRVETYVVSFVRADGHCLDRLVLTRQDSWERLNPLL
jgi:hypothetical protein